MDGLRGEPGEGGAGGRGRLRSPRSPSLAAATPQHPLLQAPRPRQGGFPAWQPHTSGSKTETVELDDVSRWAELLEPRE